MILLMRYRIYCASKIRVCEESLLEILQFESKGVTTKLYEWFFTLFIHFDIIFNLSGLVVQSRAQIL